MSENPRHAIDLEGRTAIVTGGTHGIGAVVAVKYLFDAGRALGVPSRPSDPVDSGMVFQ
ncbi:MAG TPA: hypothetical protein PLI79_01015 [Mycobacterium sp.]|nr:hypothetical protein [Mycobacterium sp.]